MYQYMHKEAPEMFSISFNRKSNFPDYDIHHSEDLHFPYERTDVRKFSIENTWSKSLEFHTRSN